MNLGDFMSSPIPFPPDIACGRAAKGLKGYSLSAAALNELTLRGR